MVIERVDDDDRAGDPLACGRDGSTTEWAVNAAVPLIAASPG